MEKSEKRWRVNLFKSSIYGDFLNNSVNMPDSFRIDSNYDEILKAIMDCHILLEYPLSVGYFKFGVKCVSSIYDKRRIIYLRRYFNDPIVQSRQ